MTAFTKTPAGLLFNPDGSFFGVVNPLGNELGHIGVVYEGTAAGRPAPGAVALGAQIVITDYGRTRWESDLTRWKPVGPQIVAIKPGITSGAIQTAEQVIGQLSCPGWMLDGNVFVLRYTLGRNNTADGFSGIASIRMATTGLVTDASIGTVGFAGSFPAGSGSLSVGTENWSRMASATSVNRLGTANAGPSFAGTPQAVALNAAHTVGDVTANNGNNIFFLSITQAMLAATTTTPQTGYMDLEIRP